MFQYHTLKLLVMIVRMLMEAKCRATGSNYEFQGENDYLHRVEKYTNSVTVRFKR